ncbi:helix-turn-helix domain-containing protein [Anaerobacillus sp. CMMVII]|uniref:CdaR family transcriptional regulator n=1 Tax=Anaerobacillus sp. CMMVII TaxID=2755588 RepID=UPI0021B7F0B4|nr:sugar diacid recognition domain-containing protein [Anaerobacillus sp. CMMVII]MCT8137144.1 helix-turn-helix domain-containing protein [Anaerobacillus sp. CMMVII]
MIINRVLAEEITHKVMKVIPYNVNIMDETGLIIGSGDLERINTYHQGAIEAINQGKMVTIYDTEGGAKPGVNIPINFRNRIIGVIGVSGKPDIVSPFASLVQVTAELLITQEFLFTERRVREQLKEEFLYQWAFRIQEYDNAFQTNAETIGVNLKIPSKAIILKGKKTKEIPYMLDDEYYIRFSPDTILFIVKDDKAFLKRIEANIKKSSSIKIGIGNTHTIIGKSVQEAQKAIELSEKLQLSERLCYYDELKFIDILSHAYLENANICSIFKMLEKHPKGIELIETFKSYYDNNGDINSVSKELHIHRNSLTYRLQKIEAITGKNPKNYKDLIQLYISYLIYNIQKE